MTITDEMIDALIADHYPAHTSPMAEIHHRECIRAIVEAVTSEYEWAISTTRQDWTRLGETRIRPDFMIEDEQ